MLYRKCGFGYNIELLFAPFDINVKNQMQHPDRKYVVTVDGNVVLEIDQFRAAENRHNAECNSHHKPGEKCLGSYQIGKHKLVNGVVTEI